MQSTNTQYMNSYTLQCPFRLTISVVTFFQLHSFGTKSITWHKFSVPVFISVVTVQRNQWQTSSSVSWLAFEV